MEAKIEVMRLKAKEGQGFIANSRSQEKQRRISPEPSGRTQPCLTSGSKLLRL
jgi:hypothetical protein